MKNEETSKDQGVSGVSNPNISKSGKVQNRAIKDGVQAWSVFDALVQAQSKRNTTNAEITRRYTGKQPHDPVKQKSLARDWQSNFPTRFLAGIIDRVVPTLINSIDSARYLTQATLPDEIDGQPIENREKKIETFREKFTQTIRQWREWRNLCSTLCQEVVLIGYAFVCWTDEDDWRGTVYRQDQAYVPDGSPQFSQYFQVFAIKQSLLIHELVDIISNKEAAKDAGWDIDNCIASLNKAMPNDPSVDSGTNPREYADVIREGNQGTSYMTGAKGVDLGHLFAIEPDKKEGKRRITHFILDRNSQDVLLERERRFDEMSDVVAPFTLEPGNAKFYGSMGLGRMLVNLSIGVDIATNDAVDQMKMAGMKIIKTDSKSAINAQIKVRAPFAIITADGELSKEDFPVNVEAFIKLYQHLTQVAEVAAGSYIPNQISEDSSGGKRTAREATIDYTRELQSKSAFVARFAGQFAEMVNSMQKRMSKKDTTDEEAKKFQEELKAEGLSRKEIDLLAASPALEVVKDLTGIENQQKTQVAAKYMGNPMVDQKKLLEADITAMTDPQFAKEIIIEEAIDPTIEAEQVRQQMMENSAIMTGESIPVSPRDNDEIHLKVLASEMKNAGQSLAKQDPHSIQPELLDHIGAGLAHANAHIQSWQSKGAKPEQTQPFEQFFGMVGKILTQLAQTIQQEALQAKQVLAQQAQIASQPPQGSQDQSNAALEPASTSETPISGMSEKVLTSWISQYQNLPLPERTRLEEIGGLGPPQPEPGQPMQPELPMDIPQSDPTQNMPPEAQPQPVAPIPQEEPIPTPPVEPGLPPMPA